MLRGSTGPSVTSHPIEPSLRRRSRPGSHASRTSAEPLSAHGPVPAGYPLQWAAPRGSGSPHRPFCPGSHPIDHAAMKMPMLVARRAEAVNEANRPRSPLLSAARSLFVKRLLDDTADRICQKTACPLVVFVYGVGSPGSISSRDILPPILPSALFIRICSATLLRESANSTAISSEILPSSYSFISDWSNVCIW